MHDIYIQRTQSTYIPKTRTLCRRRGDEMKHYFFNYKTALSYEKIAARDDEGVVN